MSPLSVPRPAIRKWIQRALANDPPRAKSLVVTLFGDAIQPHGGSIRLKALIDLLAPFGINHRLVRTSVFRLVRDQWLQPSRHGRESSYRLTESGHRRFALAYDKIYRRQARKWDGRWTLVALPVNGITRELRAHLRRELEWQGLRQLAPNLLGHPQINWAVLEEVLDRLNARRRLITLQVIESGALGTRGLAELVRSSWNLSQVIKGYREFLRRFSTLEQLTSDLGAIGPQEWFMIRTLLIHAFRRIVLHDPLLPPELLPTPWVGADAYAFVARIYERSLAGSEVHLNATIESGLNRAKSVDTRLRERFRSFRIGALD
jgi:phenylacetic acid degradation operon negative regulatory protein